MKNYPKNLNTKEDYEYVRTHFPKEKWQQDWQNLLDTEYDWIPDTEITDITKMKTDATHKIVKENEGNEEPIYIQYKLQLIPTCKLLRLGFTENYVKSILAE